jgi:prepilin-type N-terminal cleavage/methylation domain-containing protein
MKSSKDKIKSARGFTLLEVVAAMVIIAIIVPIMGIAFYQVIVVPPEESKQLTLTNEIELLSSMLYQDGYRMENFTAGTSPYGYEDGGYGTFTWTDYSSNTSHSVCYYLSPADAANPNGHIIRSEAVTPFSPSTATYNLITSVAGTGAAAAGCTISTNTSNPHASGSVVLVTANPSTGWAFSSWSDDLSGSTNPTTITMNSNKYVTATFTQISYNLITSVAGSGAISTNTSNPHASGSVILVNATPSTGWAFSSWSGDLSGSTNPTTITMNSDKSVTATFVSTIYTTCNISNWGKTIWAWKRTWNHADGMTTLHPTSPVDFLTWTSSRLPPYTPIDATAQDYEGMCYANASLECPSSTTGDGGSNYWRGADTSDPLELGTDTQLIKINIAQPRANVTNLSIIWRGHGSKGSNIYHTCLKVWNSTTGSPSTGNWITLLDKTSGLPSDIPPRDDTITCFKTYSRTLTKSGAYTVNLTAYNSSLTTNVTNFIDSTGNVSVLVSADTPSRPALQGIYTDYLEIDVVTSP